MRSIPKAHGALKTAAVEQTQDADFWCDANIPALVPAGTYDVYFRRVEKKFLWGGEKVFLWFQIVTLGDFHGVELFMSCNGPKKGKVGLSSKFYGAWVLAAGRRPDRFDRMSTNIFKGKVFLAKVRTVTRNAKGNPHPDLLHYSIIEDLLTC